MNYIDNPIIVTTSAQQVDASATFHRVIATIQMNGIAAVGSVTKTQSKPVSEVGQSIQFDIAPTLKAYAANYVYAPLSTGQSQVAPTLTATVTLHDEYMVAGRLITGAERNPAEGRTHTAYLGGYTDYERIHAQQITGAMSGSLTLKPSASNTVVTAMTPAAALQIVAVPSVFVTAASSDSNRTSTATAIAKNKAYTSLTLGETPSYAVPLTAGVMQFQFVNSRGMIEGAHAFCAMAEAIKGGYTSHIKSVPETLLNISRRLHIPDPANASLSMSSGYCSTAWARWWAYEFCRSKQHWLFVPDTPITSTPATAPAGIWVPCAITIKDGYSIFDHTKNDLPHIDFECVPDINGAL